MRVPAQKFSILGRVLNAPFGMVDIALQLKIPSQSLLHDQLHGRRAKLSPFYLMARSLPEAPLETAAGGTMGSLKLRRPIPKDTAFALCRILRLCHEGKAEVDGSLLGRKGIVCEPVLRIVVHERSGSQQSRPAFSGLARPHQ